MIKHNGFHLGDFATWDPRSDALFLYKKDINEASEYLSLPELEQVSYAHETFHRIFYKNRAICELLIINQALEKLFTIPQDLEYSIKKFPDQLGHTITHYFSYMNDVGNVLDIEHVLDMFLNHKDYNNPNLTDLKRHSRIILGHTSPKILDDFSWFDDNVKRWDRIMLSLIDCSLYLGLVHNPETEFAYLLGKGTEYLSPSEILFNLIDTVRVLYDTNQTKATSIHEEILTLYENPLQFHEKLKQLVKSLSEYSDALKILNVVEKKSLDKWFSMLDIYKIQGEHFPKMNGLEVQQQGALITVEQELDGSYNVFKRKDSSDENFSYGLYHLAISHLQECVFNNSELECYLCNIGFCDKHRKLGWLDEIHQQINTTNQIIYH